MNYKEKYEMALEGIQEILGSGEDSIKMSRLQLRLQGIFPELKENKDEKIKKWLIELVEEVRKANPTNVEHNGMCSEALDWIEKQFEHTNFRNKIQIGDQVTRNKDGVLVNLSQLKRVAKPAVDIEIPFGAKDSELIEECIHIPEGYHAFIKGDKIIITKKENPNEWKQDNIEDLTDFENAMMHIGGSFFGEHAGLNPNDTSSIKEQANILFEIALEQEWSEEDRDYYDAIIAKLEVTQDEAMLTNNQMEFLRSLKNRICPKQEWSEEDATHYNRILKELNLQKEMPINVSVIGEIKSDIIWFKDIKNRVQPQNRWNPSNEQMKALWEVYKGGEEQATLASLYSDLKKLKRE